MASDRRSKAETLSQGFARFASGLDGARLPAKVTAALKFAVMDCLAATLAGATQPVALKMLELAAAGEGRPGEASIVGHRRRAGTAGAALVNGASAHACDFDDTSETMCGHPTSPALPAILALAEARGRSGLEVLAALAAALEVTTKLGRVAGWQAYVSGWHATAALGVFGAAAGGARVLGLDADETAVAIAIAASRAAGLRANIGSMVKPMHVGFAARDGVEAALLAAAGATASLAALDGPTGFLETYVPRHDPVAGLAGRLGDPFDIIKPGIAFKKYPSCWDTHSAVDAVLALRKAHGLVPEAVKEIRCRIPPGMGADLAYPDPRTPLEGKFSMGFCLAVALSRGRLTLAEFVQDVVDDAGVRALIPRTRTIHDPAMASPNPKNFCTAAKVEIDLADGRTLGETVWKMRGHPENPMSAAEFEEKFADCARGVLDAGRAKEALRLIGSLETLSDIRPLMAQLVPTA